MTQPQVVSPCECLHILWCSGYCPAFGGAITSTSLNISGSLPAASGAEAREVLETIGADDVWLLDVGTLPESGPSTVIDCMGPVPIVLREGTVPIERIRCAIPGIYGQSSN